MHFSHMEIYLKKLVGRLAKKGSRVFFFPFAFEYTK